ncbi:hypothetical protein AAZX31_09G122900 [Glycine max]
MAVPSSSSSFTYDVFLSFRGEDTRYGFTGNLYKVLHDSGIHTFIDDEELQKGDEITTALEKAIEESIIFIVVLSQNYASSSFCLNELTASSSAVREGFELNVEKLKKWKMALREAANLSGYHFKQGDGYEYKFIKRMVERVSSKINRAPLHVADYPVGLE